MRSLQWKEEELQEQIELSTARSLYIQPLAYRHLYHLNEIFVVTASSVLLIYETVENCTSALEGCGHRICHSTEKRDSLLCSRFCCCLREDDSTATSATHTWHIMCVVLCADCVLVARLHGLLFACDVVRVMCVWLCLRLYESFWVLDIGS